MKTKFLTLFGLAGALMGLGLGAQAQSGIPHTSAPPPMHRTGSFGAGRMGMGQRPMAGMIVGNKNTKVYHLPGDKGNMPSAKNAVYFRTEAQARAAGYHVAGTHRTPTMTRRPGMMGGMSGTMRPGMTPPPRPRGSFGGGTAPH